MQDNRELIDAASRGEWTLEHDKKVLDIMQNIASKIEKRAVNTKTNINTMMLSLDETRVKMSNLTRISDVKNAVYCENLITDDHTIPSTTSCDAQVPQKNSVRKSTEVAIENGIKLVENCFEKHKLKLDPSSSRSEETIVYRPIDQFYSPLPYLIGSDKWKEKWHLGLMENEDRQSQTGSVYADSVDSSVVSKPVEQSAMESVNLSASQDSLAKSINSVGDQMVINSKQGLFDDPILSSEASSYKPQPATRNIVDFFDDEPPELPINNNQSPLVKRKPTNLFDDVESVESMPIYEPESNQENQQQQNVPLPPVDLFNDNDFDDFITKMEKNRNQTPKVDSVNVIKPQSEEKVIDSKSRNVNVQREMKSIADEISKKLQLKQSTPETSKIAKDIKHETSKDIPESNITVSPPKVAVIPVKVTSQTDIIDEKNKSEEKAKSEIKLSQNKPKQRIANLFDDEDDSEDFFQEIIKQKSLNTPKPSSKPVESVKSVPDKKISNLFDDSDEDDKFDDIFKEKTQSSTPKVAINNAQKSQSADNFEGKIKPEEQMIKIDKQLPSVKQITPKKLFDDDSDNDEHDNLFKSEATQINKKDELIEKNPTLKSIKSVNDTRSNKQETKKEEIQDKPQNKVVAAPSAQISSNDLEISQAKSTGQTVKVDKQLPPVKLITSKKLFDDDNDEFDDLFQSGTTQLNKKVEVIEEDSTLKPIESASDIRGETKEANKEVIQSKIVPDISMEPNDNEIEGLADPEILLANKVRNEPEVNMPVALEQNIPSDKDSLEPTRSDEKIISNVKKEMDDRTDIESTNIEDPSACEQKEIENEEINESINNSSLKSNFTMPLFSDEPPDDDTWDEDFNTFEEPETKPIASHSTFSPNSSSFSVPLFDELPPEDFGDSKANPPSLPDFDDELSDYEDNKKESQLEIPNVDETPVKIIKAEESKPEKVIQGCSDLNIVADDKENAIIKEQTESLTQKIENKSIKTDSEAINKEKDDKSLDVFNTSIKSKLDMFSRTPETIQPKQNEPKKLPGKLSSNLNINVGALMPGARIPLRRQTTEEEPSEKSESTENISPIKSETATGLLNNDMTKSRAKISVKRRPSTRSGRRSNYEKSLNSQITDSGESERDDKSIPHIDLPKNESIESSTVEPAKNLLKIIFADDGDDDFLSTIPNKKLEQSSAQKPSLVTTSKMSVFYDDEAETKRMLDEQKLKNEIKEEPNKLLDEKSENDNLFAKINARVSEKLPANVANQKIKPKQQQEKKVSLFDDDNDDDDLFGTGIKTQQNKSKDVQNKKDTKVKSKPLFDDDDEDDLFGASSKSSVDDKKSIIKKVQPTKSLFGDESDDDDLFSAKPKSTKSKVSTTNSTTTTQNKKQKSVVDDPLKDLMGN